MDKVVKSDAEWRAQLSDMAYKVTRKHGTERAGTHEDFPKDPELICAFAVVPPSLSRRPNSKAARAGLRSINPSIPKWLAKRSTAAFS